MALEKMLDLSTGYIKESTNDLLESVALEGKDRLTFRFTPHQHGFIVFVTDPEELTEADFITEDGVDYSELLPIMKYAHQQGCMLINFDADGDDSEGFQRFEW